MYIFLKRCDGEIVITSDLECFTFNKMLKLTFSYFGFPVGILQHDTITGNLKIPAERVQFYFKKKKWIHDQCNSFQTLFF